MSWLKKSLSSSYLNLTGSTSAIPVESFSVVSTDEPSATRTTVASTATAAEVPTDASHHTPRHSPRRLSASGNETMSQVLDIHPQFSVFRKSSSQQSLDALANSEDTPMDPNCGPVDDEEMERLASPRVSRPPDQDHQDVSPSARRDTSNTSSEFQGFSYTSDSSLQFGDGTSESISPSPSASASPTSSRSPAPTQSSVRTIDQTASSDSPPQALRRSSSTGLSRSGSRPPPTRIQFSPIHLAPSPLLGAPALPPPMPSLLAFADDDSPTHGAPLSLKAKTILKMPRTPGTGQSVRFSSSTANRVAVTEDSPLGGACEGSGEASNSFDEENSSLSASYDRSKGDSSMGDDHQVASLFSKLVAAIPSPETSLVVERQVQDTPVLSISSPGSLSYDTSSLTGLGVALDQVQASRDLFDESNPFAGHSMSMMSLEATREENVADQSAQAEPEEETSWREVEVVIDSRSRSSPPTQQDESQATAIRIEEQITNSAITPRSTSFASSVGTPSGIAQASPTLTTFPANHRPTNIEYPTTSFRSSRTSVAFPAPSVLAQESPSSSFRTSRTSAPSPEAVNSVPTLSTPARTRPALPTQTFASPALWSDANDSLAQSSSSHHELDSPHLEASSTSNLSSATSSASSSTTREVPQRSFLRNFMQKRASESAIAADALGRLIREENSRSVSSHGTTREEDQLHATQDWEQSIYGTPGEGEKSLAAVQPATLEDHSVYFSPTPADRRSPNTSDLLVDQSIEESFDVEDLRPSMMEEVSRAEQLEAEQTPAYVSDSREIYLGHDEGAGTMLSPIAEASEPNTTVNSVSPWTNSPGTDPRALPPPRPTFSSFLPPPSSAAPSSAPTPPVVAPSTPSGQRSMTLYHSTPDSRIPRLAQRRAGPSPSVNPFALSSNSNGTATVAASDLHLIQSLLSAQSDQAANSSTQRFLLSSLVSNLREEVERKDRVIQNLREQKDGVEQAWREALEDVEEWERRGGALAGSGEDAEQDKIKLKALEDVVERLTDELEKRTAVDRAQRRAREDEADSLRKELSKARTEVRDVEIRLRHARIGQAEAEEAAAKAHQAVSAATEEKELLELQKEETRKRSREEALERERVIAMLREEVAMASQSAGANNSEREAEVERRIEHARSDARQDVELVRDQLADYEATIAALRQETRTLQSSLAALRDSSTRQRQADELALLDARSQTARLQDEIDSLRQNKAAVDDELHSTQQRLEAVEVERDRLGDEMQIKDDKLALQTSAWEEHQAGMAQLMESVTRLEQESQSKAQELTRSKEGMELARREMDTLLEDRDRRLTESETALSSRIAKNEALVEECNRLKETVQNLRRGSADREVKYQRLKKIKAEQDEDIFGLNIALEAKQQEASTWKRQLASARLIAATPAPVRSRSSLTSSSPAFAAPQSTAVAFPASSKVLPTDLAKPRQRERPLSTSSLPDTATPSRSASTSTSRLNRKPSIGFGSSARREVADPAPTPLRRTRSGSSASLERAKENQRPAPRGRESVDGETPVRNGRIMLAA